MKKQHENSEETVINSTTETSPKKEWNAPEIKVVAPVNHTAGGATPGLFGEGPNYHS